MLKPWPYIYRPASPGMFGLPSMPLGMLWPISQLTARLMLSRYLPSRIVLPSISSAMPPTPVMVIGYWPPNASQWPSLCWFLAIHSSPLATVARYSAGISSAQTARIGVSSSVKLPSSTAQVEVAFIGLGLLEQNATTGGEIVFPFCKDDPGRTF